VYLMYVDESGDPGLVHSPTQYFVLSGLVMHELRWREFVDQVMNFRRRMKAVYGLGVRDEIHAAEFVRSSGSTRLPRHICYLILRHFAAELAKMNWLSVTNVVVNKVGKRTDYDVFESAWKVLFQRFENTLAFRNFPGPQNPDDLGIVICDDTNGGKLTKLMRKMGSYNPIPNQSHAGPGYRNIPIRKIIEDPNLRDSKNSHPIQAAEHRRNIPKESSFCEKGGGAFAPPEKSYFPRRARLQISTEIWCFLLKMSMKPNSTESSRMATHIQIQTEA
jgi:Protein of unknown function (DUF3800)